MTNQPKIWISALLTALLLISGSGAWSAQNGLFDRTRKMAPKAPKGMVFDRRYNHNHYYPPTGHIFQSLPHNHHIVRHNGTRFYFHGGVWYRPSGPRFIVVTPPIGITVPILPPFYTTIWVSGVPYYYADGVYYRWLPTQRAYIVSQPPPEAQVSTAPSEPEQLFIYPKQGQSDAQLSNDRYECHRWAADQSSFDPTQPPTGVDEATFAKKRSDYKRAMTACLEARGYSVK